MKKGNVSIASLRLDKDYRIGEAKDTLYGDFHQTSPEGLPFYRPESPLSGPSGFRQDYIDEINRYNMGIIRFPGGSNMCFYNWKDGIGPREERIARVYYIGGQPDKMLVGLDECFELARLMGAKVMLDIRAGFASASLTELYDELEYCLGKGGTYWSDKRIANGHKEPYEIPYICIGNEEDGPWEFAQHTPESYGHFAREAAKLIKNFDPSIKVIVCGTSNPSVPTYPEWDRIVLDMAFEYVDYLSIHYIRACDPSFKMGIPEPHLGVEDLGYISKEFSDFIEAAQAVITFVKAKHRSQKDIKLSIEEWFKPGAPDKIPADLSWSEKAELSDSDWEALGGRGPNSIDMFIRIQNMFDLLLYVQDYITILNHTDSVEISTGGFRNNLTIGKESLLKTCTYYAAELLSHYGRGYVLRGLLESPTHQTERWGEVPSLKAAAVYNEEKEEVSVFAINMNLREEIPLDIVLTGFEDSALIEHVEIWDREPMAGNSFTHPDRILPKRLPTGEKIALQPLSFHFLRFSVNKKA